MNEDRAVYMDRRSLTYLREYVRGETDFGGSMIANADTAIYARRLKYAGILAEFSEPRVVISEEGARFDDWGNHTSLLSPIGEYLRRVYETLLSDRSPFEFNFWVVNRILDIFPMSWLKAASDHQHLQREMPSTHLVTNFMAVFQMEFPLDPIARAYLQERIASGREAPLIDVELPGQYVDVPVQVDATFVSPSALEDDFSFEVDREPITLDGDGFPVTLGLGRATEPAMVEDDAADFDFGAGDELPDEEAGNMDQGGDDEDFADEGPMLTPEEEADGWQV